MQRETATAPRPFWHRLNTFFAFPLQPKPLMYSVLLALSSLLFKLIFFVPDARANRIWQKANSMPQSASG